MEGIADRMKSKDFAWVVMAIRIQREVGGNLAELLTTVSATLRERETAASPGAGALRRGPAVGVDPRAAADRLRALPRAGPAGVPQAARQRAARLAAARRRTSSCSSSARCGCARPSRWRSEMDASMLLVLGLGGIFLAIAIALATMGAITSERQQVSRSLAAVQAIQAAPQSMQDELNRPFGDRVVTPTLARLTRLGRRLTAGDQVGADPAPARARRQPAAVGRRPGHRVQDARPDRRACPRRRAPSGSSEPASCRPRLRGRAGAGRLLRAEPGALPDRLQPDASRCAASCPTRSTS